MNRTDERDDGIPPEGAQCSVAELLARYGDPSTGGRRHRRRAPEAADETTSHSISSRITSDSGVVDRSAHVGRRRAIEPDPVPVPPAPYPPQPREAEMNRPVGVGRRAALDPWLDAVDDEDTRCGIPVMGEDDPFATVPPVEPETDEIPRSDLPVREAVPMPMRRNRSHGQPPAGLTPRAGAPAGPVALRSVPAPPAGDALGVDVRDDLEATEVRDAAVEPEEFDAFVPGRAAEATAPRAKPVDDPYVAMYGADGGLEDLDELDEDEPSPVREWALVGTQVGLGVVGGAVLWLVCEWLWQSIPVVALVVALLVITGLVWVVRYVRRTEDLQTTVTAVLVGLFVTVSPAALLLVDR